MTGLENSHLVEPTIENTLERGHHKPGKANFISVSALLLFLTIQCPVEKQTVKLFPT